MSVDITPLTPIALETDDASGPESMRYVTDGTRLLRLLGRVDQGDVGTAVALEDCLSLEVVLLPPEDLSHLTLVRVPSAAPARTVS